MENVQCCYDINTPRLREGKEILGSPFPQGHAGVPPRSCGGSPKAMRGFPQGHAGVPPRSCGGFPQGHVGGGGVLTFRLSRYRSVCTS